MNKSTGPGSSENTPLHLAVGSSFDDIVRILLRHGASASVTNSDGETALQLAERVLKEMKADSPAEARHAAEAVVEILAKEPLRAKL